jgi:6-phosphogluconolactonase
MDRASGALSQLQVMGDIRNPTWLAVNPARTRLYAVSEIDNYDDAHDGAVVSYTSFRQSSATGILQFTGRFEPVGSPAHMTILSRG